MLKQQSRFTTTATRWAMVLVAAGTLSTLVWAGSPKKKPPPKNAVQHEMLLLQTAMQKAVEGIAAGDVTSLPKALHAAHMAGQGTEKALKGGEYKLPQNADRVDAFLALDASFHDEMIKMVKAAKNNDIATTAEQFGVLMTRCNGCHVTYRGPLAKR